MNQNINDRGFKSYVVPALAGSTLLCLALGAALVASTFQLNRFERYLDLAVLWLYLQIPLLAGSALAALLLALAHKSWDAFRGRTSSLLEKSILPVALGCSVLVVFWLLVWVRANWWYADLHAWVETWWQSMVFLLASLVGILVAGAVVFLVLWKVLRRGSLLTTLTGRRYAMLVLALVGSTHGVFLACALALGGHGSAADAGDIVLPVREGGAASPLVLLGVDGATWRVIDPLLEKGELPNLRSIMERGSHGPLASTKPTNSPILWTSIATGVRREQHGVMNFMVQHPSGMTRPVRSFPSHIGLNTAFMLRKLYGGERVRTYPVTMDFRRSAAVWEIAGALGVEVGVVNWWPSWPAREVNGFMVSNRFDEFVSLKARRAESGEKPAPGAAEGLTFPPDLLVDVVRQAEERGWTSLRDQEWVGLSLELYALKKPELLLVYLPGPDGAQHDRWNAFEPQYFRSVSPELVEKHGDDIPNVYRRLDRLLGRMVEALGEQATFLIVSDHGASPIFDLGRQWKAGHEHAPDGLFVASGPGIQRAGRVEGASILDIAPTVLALLGIPIGENMEGRPLAEVLTPQAATGGVRRIATWDFLVTETTPGAESQLTEEAEKALKALGYI